MYEEMINYVRDFLEKTDSKATQLKTVFPFRNRFEHSMRVYKWAKRINEIEKGDEEVISIAAIFHDVAKGINGGKNHGEVGAKICKEYLQEINFDKRKTEMIVQAIRNHSKYYKSNMELSLEDKIIMDADALDEVGALTILWDSMATGMEDDPSYTKVYYRLLSVLERRRRYRRTLRTEYGRKLYAERTEFLEEFIKNLKYELGI